MTTNITTITTTANANASIKYELQLALVPYPPLRHQIIIEECQETSSDIHVAATHCVVFPGSF
jgi:hypothetical protein